MLVVWPILSWKERTLTENQVSSKILYLLEFFPKSRVSHQEARVSFVNNVVKEDLMMTYTNSQ